MADKTFFTVDDIFDNGACDKYSRRRIENFLKDREGFVGSELSSLNIDPEDRVWVLGNIPMDLTGVNVDMADKNGVTPVIMAAWKGSVDALKNLIAAGANVNAASRFGRTALSYAKLKGRDEAVKVLDDAGAVE